MIEHLKALCRLLEKEGHMTPIATIQILAIARCHTTKGTIDE